MRLPGIVRQRGTMLNTMAAVWNFPLPYLCRRRSEIGWNANFE